MKTFCKKTVSVIVPLFALSTSVGASTFTTVDLSSYVNSNVAINPQTFPTGTNTGNQSTGVPFDVATYGSSGFEGTWNALFSSSGTLDVRLDVSGQASFYALLNNYFGTQGADEYNITIKATNGDTANYTAIGGIDTRDYNSNVFTNTIASTTFPWFNNGVGQRFDLREFDLPSSFVNDTVSDFIITQVNPTDTALFSGLTFSNVTYQTSSTPEPLSSALLVFGLAIVGVTRLKRS